MWDEFDDLPTEVAYDLVYGGQAEDVILTDEELAELVDDSLQFSESAVLTEIFSEAPLELSGDGDVIWAELIHTGEWALTPDPVTKVPTERPLRVELDSDRPRVVSLKRLVDHFKSGAVENVTVPLSHANSPLENTGFIKDLKIVETGDGHSLMGAFDFRDPEVKSKIQAGTIAGRSIGVLFNHRDKRSGRVWDQVLDHVALTNRPWITGMKPFGVSLSDDVVVESLTLGSSAPLGRTPEKDNWVDHVGGLPPYIREVARALHEKRGFPLSKAIATAISRIKVWAATSKDPKTKAKAAKAIASWESKKAKSHARTAAKKLNASDDVSPAFLALAEDTPRTMLLFSQLRRDRLDLSAVNKLGDKRGTYHDRSGRFTSKFKAVPKQITAEWLNKHLQGATDKQLDEIESKLGVGSVNRKAMVMRERKARKGSLDVNTAKRPVHDSYTRGNEEIRVAKLDAEARAKNLPVHKKPDVGDGLDDPWVYDWSKLHDAELAAMFSHTSRDPKYADTAAAIRSEIKRRNPSTPAEEWSRRQGDGKRVKPEPRPKTQPKTPDLSKMDDRDLTEEFSAMSKSDPRWKAYDAEMTRRYGPAEPARRPMPQRDNLGDGWTEKDKQPLTDMTDHDLQLRASQLRREFNAAAGAQGDAGNIDKRLREIGKEQHLVERELLLRKEGKKSKATKAPDAARAPASDSVRVPSRHKLASGWLNDNLGSVSDEQLKQIDEWVPKGNSSRRRMIEAEKQKRMLGKAKTTEQVAKEAHADAKPISLKTHIYNTEGGWTHSPRAVEMGHGPVWMPGATPTQMQEINSYKGDPDKFWAEGFTPTQLDQARKALKEVRSKQALNVETKRAQRMTPPPRMKASIADKSVKVSHVAPSATPDQIEAARNSGRLSRKSGNNVPDNTWVLAPEDHARIMTAKISELDGEELNFRISAVRWRIGRVPDSNTKQRAKYESELRQLMRRQETVTKRAEAKAARPAAQPKVRPGIDTARTGFDSIPPASRLPAGWIRDNLEGLTNEQLREVDRRITVGGTRKNLVAAEMRKRNLS